MNQIIYPVLALVALVYLLAPLLLLARLKAMRTGEIHPRKYKLMDYDNPPDYLVKVNRQWLNYFETPVLFYVVALIGLHLGLSDPLFLLGAWVFVGARYVHALIHITYNHVYQRLGVFSVSLAALGLMIFRILKVV